MAWYFKMWYYSKKEAEKVALGLRKRGKQTRITRSKNLNIPKGAPRSKYPKYIYNVWYK